MTKHALDRPRATAATRIGKYLETERREGLHPATHKLIRRDRSDSTTRLSRYLEIDRRGESTS